jgi:hypothetical protein
MSKSKKAAILRTDMSNTPEPAPKIFISYAWKNQPIAKSLQSDLKRDGVEVFVDYEKITGGDSLPERISAALDWCNTLILLWSADSAESYYVRQEWTSAFHLQKRIIVCVLDGTKLPALLSGNLYLNFTPYETGYDQLCRSLGVELKARAEKTAPPETPTSKLPPQHVEMPVPQPPDEPHEPPPPVTPKRKSIADTFRRKPQPAEPTPVLKPPEIVDDAKNDETDDAGVAIRSHSWSRRKIMTATLTLIIVAAIVLTWQIVCQKPRFRDKPATLSYAQVKIMLQRNNFYCREYEFTKAFSNPQGSGFANQFERQQNGEVVFDHASGVMWEKSGSPNSMTYAEAKKYIDDLNTRRFANHNDWRLPTLDEAMSLVKPEEPNGDLYIDLIFDRQQQWIWTADNYLLDKAWVVNFNSACCVPHPVSGSRYVRVVR